MSAGRPTSADRLNPSFSQRKAPAKVFARKRKQATSDTAALNDVDQGGFSRQLDERTYRGRAASDDDDDDDDDNDDGDYNDDDDLSDSPSPKRSPPPRGPRVALSMDMSSSSDEQEMDSEAVTAIPPPTIPPASSLARPAKSPRLSLPRRNGSTAQSPMSFDVHRDDAAQLTSAAKKAPATVSLTSHLSLLLQSLTLAQDFVNPRSCVTTHVSSLFSQDLLQQAHSCSTPRQRTPLYLLQQANSRSTPRQRTPLHLDNARLSTSTTHASPPRQRTPLHLSQLISPTALLHSPLILFLAPSGGAVDSNRSSTHRATREGARLDRQQCLGSDTSLAIGRHDQHPAPCSSTRLVGDVGRPLPSQGNALAHP
jgi:hypothetical protein